MAHAPSAALSARLHTIRKALASSSIDALVVTALPNILYLTNFSGSSATLVVTAETLHFITDFRYLSMLDEARGTAAECRELEVAVVEGSYDATLVEVLGALGRARVAFEAAHLTVGRHVWLEQALAQQHGEVQLVATDGLVESARVVKDAYELTTMREAGRRLSTVAASIFQHVTAGRREIDVALDIDWSLRRAGFERTAFDTIVASGPNAALPHARPTERKLTEGDLVVLDFGGVYDSYCVDLTRTVSIGPASDRARHVHAAVLRAHDRAIGSVAPGVSRFAVDRAAREALGETGMADAFGHGTGHGLGLEVHENPRIVRRRSDVDAREEALKEGMVFTIEPGAYFQGWGGVRIEDDVAVTAGGVDRLTDVTTDLLEL